MSLIMAQHSMNSALRSAIKQYMLMTFLGFGVRNLKKNKS